MFDGSSSCVPLQLVFEAAGEQKHMGLVILSKTPREEIGIIYSI